MSASFVLGPKELEELRYLRACGFTQAELARCFYVTQTCISVYLRRLGDPLEGPPRRSKPYRWKEAA